jgi:large repetitive protein
VFAAQGASFTVNSETPITAVSPPGKKGTVNVTVTAAGGTSAITKKDHFKYAR